MNFTLALNEIFYIVGALLSLGGIYAYIKFTTAENTKEIKNHSEEIKELKENCNKMIEEDKAFKTFVTLDIYNQRNEHLAETMSDIKHQNNTIINLLTKGK